VAEARSSVLTNEPLSLRPSGHSVCRGGAPRPGRRSLTPGKRSPPGPHQLECWPRSGAATVVDEDDNLRMGWMAHIDDVVLLEKPADDRSPKRIDCYLIAEFAGGEKFFKLDPQHKLFSLQYERRGLPPDFLLVLKRDPRLWFGTVAISLFGELHRRKPHLFDQLRTAG
jgi:hypothetical protein